MTATCVIAVQLEEAQMEVGVQLDVAGPCAAASVMASATLRRASTAAIRSPSHDSTIMPDRHLDQRTQLGHRVELSVAQVRDTKPLLRTTSTSPSLTRSSIASRTGVADTRTRGQPAPVENSRSHAAGHDAHAGRPPAHAGSTADGRKAVAAPQHLRRRTARSRSSNPVSSQHESRHESSRGSMVNRTAHRYAVPVTSGRTARLPYTVSPPRPGP